MRKYTQFPYFLNGSSTTFSEINCWEWSFCEGDSSDCSVTN